MEKRQELSGKAQTIQRSKEVVWFGEFGGQFVPETLIPALDELTTAWAEACNDPAFGDAEVHSPFSPRTKK